MIMTLRALALAARGVKRQLDYEALTEAEDESSKLPLITKALALATGTVLAVYTAKQILGPIADWLGDKVPDVAQSPIGSKVLKALGINIRDVNDAIGVVPQEPSEESEVKALESKPERVQREEITQIPLLERLFAPEPPEKAANAPEGTPKRVKEPSTTKAVRKLKGENPGTSSIIFLSNQERESFANLRMRGEKFYGGKGMTDYTKSLIRSAAKRHDIPEEWLLAMVQFESGGSPNAVSSTGAIGLMQFTNGTAKAMGLTNRFDAAQNIDKGAMLMLENIKSLKAANVRLAKAKKNQIPIDLTSVYLSHQMGVGGAIELYNSSLNGGEISDQVKKNMGLNLGEKGAADYIEANTKAMAKASKDAADTIKYVYASDTKMTPTEVETLAATKPVQEAPVTPKFTPVAKKKAAKTSVAQQASPAGSSVAPKAATIAAPTERYMANGVMIHN